MVTIKDVAQRAGISYTTVSHVINKTRHVKPETIKRIELAIDELGYRPNQVARSLRTQKSLTIGVVAPLNNDPYFTSVLAGIESAAYASGYNVIVCYSDSNSEKEQKNIAMLYDKGVDAITMHCPVYTQGINDLLKLDIPVSFLQYEHKSKRVDSIRCDDKLGGYLATKHLLDYGHTRIACIAALFNGEVRHSYYDREIGWRDALLEHGVNIDERYLIHDVFWINSTYTSLKKLMELSKPPTAIFCYNDILAYGVFRAAVDLGIKIPDDLSVVGFDDISFSQYTVPRLTTVAQRKEELGIKGFNRLLKRIQQKDAKPRKIVLPPKLIIRESTKRI